MRATTVHRLKAVGQAALFILVCQLAGLLGALSTAAGGSAWYQALAKPAFNPPSWLFAPVWFVLYTLMGIAAYLVWRYDWERPSVRRALGLFAVQLALNAAWTPVFFGFHLIGVGLVVILLLWIAIILTMISFFQINRTAGWLLAPYLAWVTFAAILNAAFWLMN